MHMITKIIRYLSGLVKNLFNPAISLFAQIDTHSHVNKKAKVYGFTKVYHSDIDAFSYVGRNCQLVYAKVGKFCSIAGDVRIGMANHTLSYLSTSPIFTEKSNGTGHKWASSDTVNPYDPVVIGNDVWIGERAMVLGGVKIGNGAVIGAGAIVTHDIPPFAIAVGIPARVIRYRFDSDLIDAIESCQWWNYDEDELKGLLPYFQKSSISVQELKSLTHK